MSANESELEFASPELASIGEFLAQSSPFQVLDGNALNRTVGKAQVYYQCRGEVFNKETPEKGLRILRSGAVEIRDSNNKLLDRLGEGESFHIAGLNAEKGDVQAAVIEDALFYFIPDEQYLALRESNREFDRYFSHQRSRRLRRAARYEPVPNAMTREIRSLMSTDLLTVDSADSVRDVAPRNVPAPGVLCFRR